MKVLLEVKVDGGMKLPFSAKVETLGDLSRLGRALLDGPKKIARLLPDLKDAKIAGLKIATE